MKKIVLIFLFIFIYSATCSSQQAYRVSTQVSKPNIFLEEFTAIHCSYCPQAHEIANNLTYLFPEKINVVAVHTSKLAIPSGNEVDLRTTYGEELQKRQGNSGMPSGNINRSRYDDIVPGGGSSGYAISRNDWNRVFKTLLNRNDTASVNLWASASFNASTQEINVEVEGFVVKAIDSLFVNVYLTETFIRGSQMGSGLSEYLHRHVLRDIITGIDGEKLDGEQTQVGDFFKKAYTYSLPEKYNNLTPKLENMEIVFFITNKEGEILNSIASKIETSLNAELEYIQVGIKRIEETYGSANYDVFVVNPSDDTITSIIFEFGIGLEKEKFEIKDIACLPRTETVVCLKTNFKEWEKLNIYNLRALKANGKDVKSNPSTGDYKQAYSFNAESFKVIFSSDLHGSENQIFIKDQDGNILYQNGPFKDGEIKEYESDFIEVEKDKIYTIDFTDSFRDGVDNGGYRIVTNKDSIFYRGSVSMYGSIVALRKPSDVSSEKTTQTSIVSASLYPNPAQGKTKLFLKGFKQGNIYLKIYNLQGILQDDTIIFNSSSQGGQKTEYEIDLQNYTKGLYLVRLTQGKQHAVLKLIIEK